MPRHGRGKGSSSRGNQKDRSQKSQGTDVHAKQTNNEKNGKRSLRKNKNNKGHRNNNKYSKQHHSGSGREKFTGYRKHMEKSDVDIGLENGKFYEGTIRINKKKRTEAYVSVQGIPFDVFIDGDTARNRALEGDIVCIELLPRSIWQSLEPKFKIETDLDAVNTKDNNNLWPMQYTQPTPAENIESTGNNPFDHLASTKLTEDGVFCKENNFQPSGQVIAIREKRHRNDLLGHLRFSNNDMNGALPTRVSYILFSPRDPRYPFVKIPRQFLPEKAISDPRSASLDLWSVCLDREKSPTGKVRISIGQAGEIATETAALLRENGCDHGSFPSAVLNEIAIEVGDSWSMYVFHLDFLHYRKTRIFSIDPATAKDLDDALHITPCKLSDGSDGFEIGVHIADVSHFVRPGTALDAEAQRRSTTVYLNQFCIPMLPPRLCEQLCSLNPGEDRLAYSAVWKMKADGALDKSPCWFGRTVIHTACKLDYGTAQLIITGEISADDVDTLAKHESLNEVWSPERRPIDLNVAAAAAKDVINLHKVAFFFLEIFFQNTSSRRIRRFTAGALALHQPKLCFKLDGDGNPVSVFTYPLKDSNRLVEEYMLLANYLVAQHLLMYIFISIF
eukprot:GSMAST32.ASY1.ANO1.425.1 assembled CDS